MRISYSAMADFHRNNMGNLINRRQNNKKQNNKRQDNKKKQE